MICFRGSALIFSLFISCFSMGLGVEHLRIEQLENPIGIEYESPRLSWWLISDETDVVQIAYEVEIQSAGQTVYRTGRIKSSENHLVKTEFITQAQTEYQWKVTAWDNKGKKAISSWATFETGLFGKWQAKWIGAPWIENPQTQNKVHYYRMTFRANSEIKSVRIYVTAYGIYDMAINGKKIGNREMAPGWTSYEKRLKYQTYLADSALQIGVNCISLRLAQGWLQGRIALRTKPAAWQERLGLLLELHLTYQNGKKEILKTDKNWQIAQGGFIRADIYDGEEFDFAKEPIGWQNANFDAKNWLNVAEINMPFANIIADYVPAIKVIEELKPVNQYEENDEITVFDFGKNVTGRIQLVVNIEKPCSIKIEHAEVQDDMNTFYTKNLRTADAAIIIHFNKPGKYIYTPAFTFMGFRYARVIGIKKSEIEHICHQVLSSDLVRTGHFSCSNEKVNTLYNNIINSQNSNFLDVPIDCPQRDERLGWTGDAQLYTPTAVYNNDVLGFFKDWLADLAADQYADGAVPWVIPNVFKFDRKPSSGWADAAVIIPWKLYLQYNDIQVLKTQYESMKAWVDYMAENAIDYLWFGDMHFGDWMNVLSPTKPNSMKKTYETDYIAQVYFQHSVKILSQTALILEKNNDAAYYANLFSLANEAFLREFVTYNGRIGLSNQTAYVLALQFDLLPQDLAKKAMEELGENIKLYGHLTTGFLGTPYLCPTLSKIGQSTLAFDLLLNEDFPSWLYQVNLGATSMWERWDGITPQGQFQDPYVNSFNHYAYGAIGFWLYANMAGIKLETLNNEQILILAPEIDPRFSFCKVSYAANNGLVESFWELDGEQLTYSFEIPCNTKAKVLFPRNYLFNSLAATSDGETTAINYLLAPKGFVQLGSGKYELVLSFEL